MFTTYILFSASLNRFYVGYTSGAVASRLGKHLSTHKGFTNKASDWKIVYQEYFETKQGAIAREKQIKGWKSATRIKDLIDRSSPE